MVKINWWDFFVGVFSWTWSSFWFFLKLTWPVLVILILFVLFESWLLRRKSKQNKK